MVQRRTPFYSQALALGAQMTRVGGDFMSARCYTTVPDEHRNTRTFVGLQDLGTMGKMDIRGADAEALVNHVIVNDASTMQVGQARYSTVCRDDGGILDDLTVFRLGEAHFMLVTGSRNRWKMRAWLTHHAQGRKAYLTDMTPAMAFPTIQGPRSRELLQAVVQDADLQGLKRWTFTRGRIGETDVLVSRTGVTGELGFELFVPADEAADVWDTLFRVGQDFHLQPYGVQAMFTLGLEKAYPAHGVDMDEHRTPFHVGLDRWIRFDKGDFVGRDALLRVRDAGVAQCWVGLVLEGDTPAATDAPVFSGAETVGFVTYSDHGYSLGKVLATAYVASELAVEDTSLSVEVAGQRVVATVTRKPFYDPEGIRVRA